MKLYKYKTPRKCLYPSTIDTPRTLKLFIKTSVDLPFYINHKKTIINIRVKIISLNFRLRVKYTYVTSVIHGAYALYSYVYIYMGKCAKLVYTLGTSQHIG